jgi:osmotically-inducible protein OsmY
MLENLIAEARPELRRSDELREALERIRDAKITVPKDVIDERRMNGMFSTQSPSETARQSLEAAGFKKKDIRVSNADIVLEVDKGKVTLYGSFDHEYRHAAAISIIKTTEGVMEIEDQAQTLGGYVRTDSDLQALIHNQIRSLPLVPGEWIEVLVSNGVAKLEGQVSRPRFKAFAGTTTWELSGIKDCINLISVTDTPEMIQRIQPANEFLNREAWDHEKDSLGASPRIERLRESL